jgi:hypothetical protein
MTVVLVVTAASASAQSSLNLDQLLGTWNMSYENQGQQTGTIMISRNDDGTPKIMMSTTAGGDSEARDIKIDGDTLTYARDVSVQGQSLAVSYMAKLVDGKLEGTFDLDLGDFGAAAGALGEPTPWMATKAP